MPVCERATPESPGGASQANPKVLKQSLWGGLWEFVLLRMALGGPHPQPEVW